MDNIILLNGDFSFLNILSWKKAFILISKGKVEVLKATDRIITTASGVIYKMPIIMRLMKLVRTVYKKRIPFSRRNVMIRDNFKCTYCGKENERLTIDHVIPKSKGGKSSFENCVAACKPCNTKKGDKLPSKARMFPKTKMQQPTINEFLMMRMKNLGIDNLINELFVT